MHIIYSVYKFAIIAYNQAPELQEPLYQATLHHIVAGPERSCCGYKHRANSSTCGFSIRPRSDPYL